jgi:tryptophan synthase alpha chain
VHDALTCAKNVRQHIDVPIVLFSYFQSAPAIRPEPFAPAATQAGIDAVLVTDLIPEEAESWTQNLLRTSTRSDLLVAPTTSTNGGSRESRSTRVIHLRSFARWRTGERDQMTGDAEALVSRARRQRFARCSRIRISTPEQVRSVWRFG